MKTALSTALYLLVSMNMQLKSASVVTNLNTPVSFQKYSWNTDILSTGSGLAEILLSQHSRYPISPVGHIQLWWTSNRITIGLRSSNGTTFYYNNFINTQINTIQFFVFNSGQYETRFSNITLTDTYGNTPSTTLPDIYSLGGGGYNWNGLAITKINSRDIICIEGDFQIDPSAPYQESVLFFLGGDTTIPEPKILMLVFISSTLLFKRRRSDPRFGVGFLLFFIPVQQV